MFDKCNNVNDYIEEIFKIGLKQQYEKAIDNAELNGYYLSVPSRNKENIKNLNQWARLFINIKTKSNKVYGEMDTENSFAD